MSALEAGVVGWTGYRVNQKVIIYDITCKADRELFKSWYVRKLLKRMSIQGLAAELRAIQSHSADFN